MRASIGTALPVDEAGDYLTATWAVMRWLFPESGLAFIHSETVSALSSLGSHDQAFDAIFRQEFGELLDRVRCPVRIVQACDDPLTAMLDRVRSRHSGIPIELIGASGLAAPEYQAEAFARALLAFTDANESAPRKGYS